MATTLPGHVLDRGPVLGRLIRRVRVHGAPEFFPPVVTDGPHGTLAPDRALGGGRDADEVAALLGQERFAPLRRALERLDAWCVRTGSAVEEDVLAPGLLDPVDSGAFGATLGAVFTACFNSPPDVADRLAEQRTGQLCAALDLFLARLRTDLRSPDWPRDARLRGPVTDLSAQGTETHNGGLRVLRLRLAGGGRVAYKPRPANGEALFLADGERSGHGAGLFARINALPQASGPVRLPVLGTWTGSGPGAAGYSWQEWIEPPAEQGAVRVDGRWTMTGTVLAAEDAARFWRRAGNLAAACVAFGISDLIGGNILAGARPHRPDDEPMLYPVDLECYFTGLTGLRATGLVPPDRDTAGGADADLGPGADAGPAPAEAHPGPNSATAPGPASDARPAPAPDAREPSPNPPHPPAALGEFPPGLEDTADWPDQEGGALVWRRSPRTGVPRPAPMDRPLTRTAVPSAVADTEGRIGRAHYLPAMLRGMFDAWTLFSRHREALRGELERGCPGSYIRIVPRPTADYARAIDARLRGVTDEVYPDGEPFGIDEKRQLGRWDVPYYFCAASGGPLLAMDPAAAPFTAAPVPAEESPEAEVPEFPTAGLHRYRDAALGALGPALRDAVASLGTPPTGEARTLSDPALGVRLRWSDDGGRVDFDWPRAGRRVGYEWSAGAVRVHLEELARPTTGSDVPAVSATTPDVPARGTTTPDEPARSAATEEAS
ncbi:DUF4135 domain-containing protein [Embleya sp. NPDC008237]|uniref:DUF4135 domain-containing protein n=1 Tax=Embleya sp. NPDC008237 TaxID=3363978 RepID=UPI0036EB7071